MDSNNRKLIEAMKDAARMAITLYLPEERTPVVISLRYNKKLYHDIALAYQDAVNRSEQ